MTKKLLTTFLFLTLLANLFAVIPPHVEGEGGCSEDCCVAAQQDMPESISAILCCAINCKQNAETNSVPASVVGAPQSRNHTPVSFVHSAESASYIQQTQFPSSPTRHIAGSSVRYLENNTFLI